MRRPQKTPRSTDVCPPAHATAVRALVLGAAASLVTLGAAGCVSKSVYLQKVDDAVRHASQAEAYKRELLAAAKARSTLTGVLEAEERKVAVCELNLKAVREARTRTEADLTEAQTRIKKTADDANEARAQLAVAREEARGCENRIANLKIQQAAERRKEPDLTDVTAALKAEVDASAGLITLTRPKGAVHLRIPTKLFFSGRTARVSEDGKQLASRLADILGRLRDRAVLVEGHQDQTPVTRRLGSPTELSLTQAYAVALFLVRAGLDSSRVSVVGVGSRRMLAAETAANAEDLNQRIEIVVTPTPVAAELEVIGPDAAPSAAPSPQPPPASAPAPAEPARADPPRNAPSADAPKDEE